MVDFDSYLDQITSLVDDFGCISGWLVGWFVVKQ
jgi:hypothetical protein